MEDAAKTFLELTFDGGRFAAHSVPVDVLAELATVQQLILRVARHLFFQHHPDRKRLPRGFLDAAQLHLAASESNCFTAELHRPGTWAGASPQDLELFEEARDLSISALFAAGEGQPLPASFPAHESDLLVEIGRRLNDDEGLVIRGGAAVPAVRVDQQSRARLARVARRPLERVESLDGEVEQLDDVNDRFWLRTREGERIEIPFETTQREVLLEALALRPIARVRVRGQLVLTAQRKMKRVEELEIVDDERAPEVQRVWDRLRSFERITDGWLEGEGRAPTQLALARAQEVLARLLIDHRGVERPHVFPSPQGGVQAEWVIGQWAAEICFDPEDGSIEAEATHGDTGEERPTLFTKDRVTAEDVTPLVRWLESLN